ncbi:MULTISPECIES: helix-turn-helix domain-containing protein [unclassified Streptomyces]|uniref:helix-turn-helix domain-containing protein n=1 Tax=unclassified Streptomyces TaxID=2593676 RepID=UPI00340F30F3
MSEPTPPRPLLPLPPGAGAPPAPPERADAARNRARILAAAARLFSERDPASVTMEDIAKAAGVGRGTLYRRYPDRAAIARALLDEHERALQEKLLRGAPPLGPGGGPGERPAPPAERLAAFYAEMTTLLEAHLPLALGAETGAARYGTGAYGFWHAHVTHLVREAALPDPQPLADHLLAPLAPELFRHQRELGLSREHIAASLGALARRTLGH